MTTPTLFRPNSSSGYWLCSLIPIAYVLINLTSKKTISIEFQMSTSIATALFLKTFGLIWYYLEKADIENSNTTSNKVDNSSKHFFDFIICSILVIFSCNYKFLKFDVILSILLAFFSLLSYDLIFCQLLKALPKCFTFGECSIVAQGITIFLSNVLLKFIDRYWYLSTIISTSDSNMQQIQMILQVSLTGLFILICLTYLIKIFRNPIMFAVSTILVIVGICLFPITEKNDHLLIVLMRFTFGDYQRIIITIIYLGLVLLAVGICGIYVHWNDNNNDDVDDEVKSSPGDRTTKTKSITTRTRKLFHLLIVLVYVPGIIYQCVYVFIASGLFLGILIYLEMLRLIKFPYLSNALNLVVNTFIDEKDSGAIALTPIYLLIGCSIPIWLHPFPCSFTVGSTDDFLIITLLAGILSVGIGDTAASFFGSKYGAVKFKNSSKSHIGLFASVVCQGIFIYIFYYFEIVHMPKISHWIRIIIAIVINANVEAKTDQIDNILLPLITFIILS